MSRLYDSRSSFGPTLESERMPIVGGSRPRCSRELAAWRALALILAVLVVTIAALVLR